MEHTPEQKFEALTYTLVAACAIVAFVVATYNDTAKKPSAVPDLVEKTGEHFTKGAIRAIKDELSPIVGLRGGAPAGVWEFDEATGGRRFVAYDDCTPEQRSLVDGWSVPSTH